MKDVIQRRFRAFHQSHPEVYAELVRLARKYQEMKVQAGIGHFWEIARYKLILRKQGLYKLNNNFRSRYARLIMDQEEDLRGYFETRALRSSYEAIDEDVRRNYGLVSGIRQMGGTAEVRVDRAQRDAAVPSPEKEAPHG